MSAPGALPSASLAGAAGALARAALSRIAGSWTVRPPTRGRIQSRLVLLALFFAAAFGTVVLKLALVAAGGTEARAAWSPPAPLGRRAPLLDRAGRVLATNLPSTGLYAEVRDLVDPRAAAEGLAAILPGVDAEAMERRLSPPRKFVWIAQSLSPEQRQAVMDIGDPGLRFAPRQMRLYPNGPLAAHVLGGVGYEDLDVHDASIQGRAGLELALDARLSDPARADEPLRLSLDLTVQDAVEDVLAGAMALLDAKGASAVLMEAATGEVVALASLPDFDPNARPRPLAKGDRGDDPLFNRAVQGVYELGSVFKIFTAAQMLELGLATEDTPIDTQGPLVQDGFRIREFENKNYGPTLSVAGVMAKSSNIGTARMAMTIGGERQRAFLERLGLFAPTGVELAEAPGARPIVPPRWPDLTAMTASYGHGVAVSPLHLAAAYSAVVNGGHLVRPTLVDGAGARGARILSTETSAAARRMLRKVVVDGTSTMAQIDAYPLGGKTGTADKPRPQGGYYEDRTITTFAAAFPIDAPEYVLVVTLDEPRETSYGQERRSAGWTAVPAAAEIALRVGPMLGLRPAAGAAR